MADSHCDLHLQLAIIPSLIFPSFSIEIALLNLSFHTGLPIFPYWTPIFVRWTQCPDTTNWPESSPVGMVWAWWNDGLLRVRRLRKGRTGRTVRTVHLQLLALTRWDTQRTVQNSAGCQWESTEEHTWILVLSVAVSGSSTMLNDANSSLRKDLSELNQTNNQICNPGALTSSLGTTALQLSVPGLVSPVYTFWVVRICGAPENWWMEAFTNDGCFVELCYHSYHVYKIHRHASHLRRDPKLPNWFNISRSSGMLGNFSVSMSVARFMLVCRTAGFVPGTVAKLTWSTWSVWSCWSVSLLCNKPILFVLQQLRLGKDVVWIHQGNG